MVNAEIRVVVMITGGNAAAEIAARSQASEEHAALNPFGGLRYFLALEGPTIVDSTSAEDAWRKARSLVNQSVPGAWSIQTQHEPTLEGHAWIENRWVKTATVPGGFAHAFELLEYDLVQQSYIAATRTLVVARNGQPQTLEVRSFLVVQNR
jgi:hypothetical protein